MTQHPDDGVLHALLDGEIRAAELPAIEAHLRSCPACHTRLEEARAFRDEAERLVGEIELPAEEQAVPVAATSSTARPRSARRLTVRPLAYAATLLMALGLGYGMRGWVGFPRGTERDATAELAAVPVAPSESSLADLVTREESASPRIADTRGSRGDARAQASGDTAPRLLAHQDAPEPVAEKPTAPPAHRAPDTVPRTSPGFAAGRAAAPAPTLDRDAAGGVRQESGERRFEGKVTDQSGRGIAGASVMVLGTRLQARTGNDGEYRLEGEIPDSSQVTARAIGYQAAAKSVALSDSGSARVDFALPTAMNRLEEIVVGGNEARGRVSSLRSPVVLRTPPPAFQTVDFPEAIRRLGGRIRLVDGLVPSRLEALGDTVRVAYRVGRGQEVWLRQFRVGDTVAFILLPPPGFSADSLARLTARVSP